MSGGSADRAGSSSLRFLFDHHVNARALRALRSRGLDIVHAHDVGLAEADDAEVFAWARLEGRIVVTRNYRDFAPLVQAYARRGESFPGVLFYATSVAEPDVGAHVRALEAWTERVARTGVNPAADSFDWLR